MVLNQGLPVPAEILESQPAGAPRGRGLIAALAAGAFTDIVAINGPVEALAGEKVTVQVVIKNTWTGGFYIASTGAYNGTSFTLSPDYAGVDPGATYSFTVSFTMPNKNITLDIWSFYWTGTEWHQDDHEAVTIKLKTLTPEFGSFGVQDYSKV